jgi:hypothetical protein
VGEGGIQAHEGGASKQGVWREDTEQGIHTTPNGVLKVVTLLPADSVSLSRNVIFPGISMSNKCICHMYSFG